MLYSRLGSDYLTWCEKAKNVTRPLPYRAPEDPWTAITLSIARTHSDGSQDRMPEMGCPLRHPIAKMVFNSL